MKTRILQIAFTLLLILPALPAKSQLTPYTPGRIMGLPDTVTMGDTLDLSYYVINNTGLPLTNPLILSWVQMNGVPRLLPEDSTQILGIIQPGDTVTVNLNRLLISPSGNNNGGANVIVVWPTSGGNGASDSLSDPVWVEEPPTAIDEGRSPGPAITIYPNPAEEFLRLESNEPGLTATETVIFNIAGQIMLKEEGLPLELDLTSLKEGVYFLMVSWKGHPPTIESVIVQ